MSMCGKKPAETGIQERPTTKVELDPGIVTPLRKEAARRDMSLQRLVTDLLDVIADQLTTAILDMDESQRS